MEFIIKNPEAGKIKRIIHSIPKAELKKIDDGDTLELVKGKFPIVAERYTRYSIFGGGGIKGKIYAYVRRG